jgi:hypothetical protein
MPWLIYLFSLYVTHLSMTHVVNNMKLLFFVTYKLLQAFPAWPNVMKLFTSVIVRNKLECLSSSSLTSLVPCLRQRPQPSEWSTSKMLHSKVMYRAYPRTLDKAGQACQGQTLKHITNIHKFWT